jgi:hypothetical protein
MADYACDGSIQVRATPEFGHIEVALGVEEFRTCRHVGWLDGDHPRLVLDRFPVTYAGAFKASAVELRGGYLDPVAARSEVIKYKQVLSRAKQQKYALSRLKDAESWLRDQLGKVEPQTGLRDQHILLMVSKFAIPTSRAARIWREVTVTMGWRKRGRPRGSKTRQKIVR